MNNQLGLSKKEKKLSSGSSQLYSDEAVNPIRTDRQVLKNKDQMESTVFKKRKAVKMVNIAIFLFCVSSLLYNVEQFQIIGYSFLIMAIVFFALGLIWSIRDCHFGALFYIVLSFLTGFFIWELSRNISFRSIEVFVCFLISLIVFHLFASVKVCAISKTFLKLFIIIELMIIIPTIIWGSAYNPIDGGFKSIYTTSTFLGLFSCLQIELCILLYLSSKNKFWVFCLVIFLLIIWMTKVRTAYACVAIILFAFLFNRISLTRNKVVYVLLKWFFIISIAAIIVLYPQLESFEWFDSVSDAVYANTGKVLMSGRNEVWAEGFIYISRSPVYGYGLDTFFLDMSMHSSYLQLILESGAIGIISFFILINIILNQILKNTGKIYKLLFVFSLVNLLMATTEVMLLHGQMILQILVWIILGMGLNKSMANLKF